MKLKKNPMFWISAVLSFLLDHFSKQWVVAHFQLHQTLPLWPNVFHFTYEINRGAAFSLFQGAGWLRWLSLLVTLGLIYYGLFGSPLRSWEQMGYGFLLGGAAGNGLDRLSTGQVVDFLHFKLINFPVFNVADVAINIGLVCLFISLWTRKPQPDQPSAMDPEESP
jgi:signal peptidase II